MEQFKRAQVIMLPTNTKTYIGKFLEDEPYLTLYNWYLKSLNIPNQRQGQHLYIISDDEIKEGDWFIDDDCSLPVRAGYNKGLSKTCKKIIATTDTSLLIDTYINQGDTVKGDLIIKRGSDYTTGLKGRINLPQPSRQFIEKYIEEYNKGNIITDVLVEYEPGYVNPEWNKEKLKINPKDNTITIKKVKDNWNREEVKQLLLQAMNYSYSGLPGNLTPIEGMNKWIEENL